MRAAHAFCVAAAIFSAVGWFGMVCASVVEERLRAGWLVGLAVVCCVAVAGAAGSG